MMRKFNGRRELRAGIAAAALLSLGLANPARAADDPARAARWTELSHALFGGRAVQDGAQMLALDAPTRAEDAALVPLTITVNGPVHIAGLYVVVDDNPSPLAAHFSFGPAADTHRIDLRVRVDQYTDIHAVAETTDGRLLSVARFVKASGGCSATAGMSPVEAMASAGQMKLRVLGDATAGRAVPVELLIRHPNFNGMQMDQVTRLYTPARYLDHIDVAYGGATLFHLDADISMSSDPAIGFAVQPKAGSALSVVAHDTRNTVFSHSFDLPARPS